MRGRVLKLATGQSQALGRWGGGGMGDSPNSSPSASQTEGSKPSLVPAPQRTRPRGTCLYLAGRLQPQACSRPSSLRTCSRTWRYCSRFCSRRAEEVQSLGGRNRKSLL